MDRLEWSGERFLATIILSAKAEHEEIFRIAARSGAHPFGLAKAAAEALCERSKKGDLTHTATGYGK